MLHYRPRNGNTVVGGSSTPQGIARHQRIALITGPLCEDCSQDRQNGYVAALASYSIQPDPALILEGDWSATSGYWAVKTLLET